MQIPDEISTLCQIFLAGLKNILGDNLIGIYLFGAMTFPQSGPIRDIDFHVILKEKPDDNQKSKLPKLHAHLAESFPPLGAELDGYYILLADTRQNSPPIHQFLPHLKDDSWALHCMHIRAGRCIVLYGPDPLTIYPDMPWTDIEMALQGELNFVKPILEKYPDYCVLNLCRLMYSYETRNVVTSKRASGKWAKEKYPEWGSLIDAAVKSYDEIATDEDRKFMKHMISEFHAFVLGKIHSCR
jgi:hypothetical protein